MAKLKATQKLRAIPEKERDIHIRPRPGDRARFALAVEKSHADDLSAWMRGLAHAECDRLKIPR